MVDRSSSGRDGPSPRAPGLGRGQCGAGVLAFGGIAQVAEDALHRLGTLDGAGSLRLGPRLRLHLLECLDGACQAVGRIAQAAGELLGGPGGGRRSVGSGFGRAGAGPPG